MNAPISKFYNNNPNLKSAGVRQGFTAEQIEERLKCTRDPLYFIEKYIKIVNVDNGLVPFEMWQFQKDMINIINKNRYVIAKWPRQQGKTTTVVAYLLWVVLFGPLKSIAILANKGSTAKDILAKFQLAYEHIPFWMQQGIVAWNKQNIELENGSKIVAAATGSSAARGGSYNILVLDEFAFVPQHIAEDFFTSVYPTITSGKTTKVVIISTPKGMNHFYKMWTDAVQKRSKYMPFETHWSEHPHRDEKWYEDTIANLGEEKFEQEFGTSFLGSADTLIESSKLKNLAWVSPKKVLANGFLQIYEEPEAYCPYVITVDVSRGTGEDYSAFSVFDVSKVPYKQVAKYKNNQIAPMVFPSVIYNVAQKYNSAYVLVENNDIGGEVLDLLHADFEYENIFSTTNNGGRNGQKLSQGHSKKVKLGVTTTHKMKTIGCATLKTLIESNKLIIEDFSTIEELTTFIATGKSFAAEKGRNDDLCMTLVLFAWLTSQTVFKELTDINIQRRIQQEKEKMVEEQILPFGHNIDSEDAYFRDSTGQLWQVEETFTVKDFANIGKWWSNPTYVYNEDFDDDDVG